MIRFLRVVVVVVVAAILLMFAAANRQIVAVSFDPFGPAENPAFAIPAPLFAIVIVSVMLGVIAGSAATWMSQGRHRRAARRNRAEAARWRTEAEAARAHPPALTHS